MGRPSRPITLPFPPDRTPARASAVHEVLDDLLARMEAHYGMAVQQWLAAGST